MQIDQVIFWNIGQKQVKEEFNLTIWYTLCYSGKNMIYSSNLSDI